MDSYSMWGPRAALIPWPVGAHRHTRVSIDDRPIEINNFRPSGRRPAGRPGVVGTWRHMTTP